MKFVARLRSTLQRHRSAKAETLIHDEVKYYDFSAPPDNVWALPHLLTMHKQERFSSQHEYRCLRHQAECIQFGARRLLCRARGRNLSHCKFGRCSASKGNQNRRAGRLLQVGVRVQLDFAFRLVSAQPVCQSGSDRAASTMREFGSNWRRSGPPNPHSSRFPPCKPSAVNNCTGSRLPDFHAGHSGTGSLGFHAASRLIIQPFADMILTPCCRLGPPVLSAIGGSARREGYRARDTKLIVTSR